MKSFVNQRWITPSAAAATPSFWMRVMRWFQMSGWPKWLDVLASTARVINSGALAHSHMPTMPPRDKPQ